MLIRASHTGMVTISAGQLQRHTWRDRQRRRVERHSEACDHTRVTGFHWPDRSPVDEKPPYCAAGGGSRPTCRIPDWQC
eukprot:4076224-Amphidinium_carterae.1